MFSPVEFGDVVDPAVGEFPTLIVTALPLVPIGLCSVDGFGIYFYVVAKLGAGPGTTGTGGGVFKFLPLDAIGFGGVCASRTSFFLSFTLVIGEETGAATG